MNKKEIIENIETRGGIEHLNPMQLAVLSSEASRIILEAPTGTGKTLAFTCGLLRSIDSPNGHLQGLVVAPSRELVRQTAEVIRRVATGYKTAAFYGGHSMTAETDSIEGGVPDIIVATPGRMLDHLKRETISTDNLRALIFDEYDKSLEMGFEEEMRKLCRRLPRRRRLTLLSSATHLAAIPDFVDMEGAVTIDYTDRSESPRDRMEITEVRSYSADKLQTLNDLLLTIDKPGSRSIIFVNHRESAERVFDYLRKQGFQAILYHGGLEQRNREEALDLFENGSYPILVATDLGARGLDIEGVDNVVHYHLPLSAESWTHRNGRTARIDRTGNVYAIVSDKDNLPEYLTFDRELVPNPEENARPLKSGVTTLYMNLGKKEKISRGDVAGFMMKTGGLAPDQVGKIIIKDHSSLVAVPSDVVSSVIEALKGGKLKGKSVRVSVLKNIP